MYVINKQFLYCLFHSKLITSSTSINYDASQSLEGECISQCNGSLTFEWELLECTDKNKDCVTIEPSLFASMITTKTNGLFYSSRPNAYKEDQWYKLLFRGKRSATNVFGETSLNFFVNKSPENGTYTSIGSIVKLLSLRTDYFRLP